MEIILIFPFAFVFYAVQLFVDLLSVWAESKRNSGSELWFFYSDNRRIFNIKCENKSKSDKTPKWYKRYAPRRSELLCLVVLLLYPQSDPSPDWPWSEKKTWRSKGEFKIAARFWLAKTPSSASFWKSFLGCWRRFAESSHDFSWRMSILYVVYQILWWQITRNDHFWLYMAMLFSVCKKSFMSKYGGYGPGVWWDGSKSHRRRDVSCHRIWTRREVVEYHSRWNMTHNYDSQICHEL